MLPIFPHHDVLNPTDPTKVSVYARFVHGEATYERASLTVTFENGWEESRARGSAGRWKEFVVLIRCNQYDMQIIFDFLDDRQVGVEKFTYTHPHWGTGTVKYASPEMVWKPIVNGDPIWFEFEMRLRGQFS